MDKVLKELKKAQLQAKQAAASGDVEPLGDLLTSPLPPPPMLPQSMLGNQQQLQQGVFKRDRELTIEEKKYLLATERGDIATVKSYLDDAPNLDKFNMNAVDPLGRSALHIAIEYENIAMIELLLAYHVDVGEALLHAINEEFVEAVEMLLHYQDNGMIGNEVCLINI